ncbi:MAG: hypothetical protein JWO30_583 [Fibrobacteres bacterium]|nr:hypothetical protein [Fibrobacterota bacterium]
MGRRGSQAKADPVHGNRTMECKAGKTRARGFWSGKMFQHSYSIFSGFNRLFRRVGALALILGASAQAQTWYWNPSAPLLSGAGDVQKSYNWTSQQAGGGAWPKSALDDDFTSDALGSNWTFRDNDNDAATGSMSLTAAADQLTLSGKGADIWFQDNQYTAVWRNDITGNFDVSVKVVSQSNSFEWAKAGILVYNDFTNPAAGGCFAVVVTPQNGIKVQFDSTGNIGEFEFPEGAGATPLTPVFPVWLRAVKKGGVFSGYYKTALNNAWTLLRTAVPQGTAANSQIGLFATSHSPTAATTVVFDDFQAGGDIQANNLNLSFNGTSATADADANLTASFGAQSLDMTGYPGAFSFGSSTLTLSGNADFSNQVNLIAGTGTLAFNGTGLQTLAPRPGAVHPNLSKSGSGTLQIKTSPLVAGVLNMQAGVFDLGSRTNEFAGLVSSGGSFSAMGASDTLIFTGDANFSGITSMPAGGSVQIRSVASPSGARTVQFNPGNAAFPNLYLWNQPSTFPASIVVAAGTLQVKGSLIFRDEKTSAGLQGILDFKTGNTNVSVDGDLARVDNGPPAGANSLQFLMGNGTWTAKGNVALSFANAGEAGKSQLDLAGAAPANQILTITNGSLGSVRHIGTGTMTLGAALNGLSFSQSAGTVNFNGSNLSVTGAITVTNGTSASLAGLGGRDVHADGSISLTGQAGNLLNLNPAANWNIYAGGALNADFAVIAKSAVTGPQTGTATANCTDGLGNTRWTFPPNTTPPAIVREPKDSIVLAGVKAGFSVSASGAPTLTYAWRKRGDTATLSTDSVFSVNAPAASDDGALYYCTVSNAFGSAPTRDAKLTVNVPASLAREPVDTAVLAGSPASFSVSAKGKAPLGFQWHRVGVANPVGSDSVLSLGAVTPADNGALYYCIVANAYGNATTRQARLTVNEPALVTREPNDTAVAAGRTARFSVGSKGTGPLAYAWRKQGDPAVVSTDTVLTLAAAALADGGSIYYCVVSNPFGSDTTRGAKLIVAESALITREPADFAAGLGKRAVFSVGAVGAQPLAFNWHRKGDTATLSADSVLSLDSIKLKDDGALFSVIVTNAFGKDTSREAKLSVVVCDSVFSVTPETLSVDEGQPAQIKGKAACSQGYFWSVVSGPAPKLLDPEVDVLAFIAPRVPADTVIVYRFTADYGTNTVSKDVVVKVRGVIPDPLITLPVQSNWNGAAAFIVRPVVTNAAALKLSPYAPPFHYQWFLSVDMADTAQAGDSLALSEPVQDGILEVTLCLDNGGAVHCAVSAVTVSRLSSGLAFNRSGGLGPITLSGRSLIWNAKGRVRIWNWQGRLLWEGRGNPGEISELPQGAAKSLLGRRAKLEILTPGIPH